MALNYAGMGPIYMLRSEVGYSELEKRQLFLRSYQFSRKQSVSERIKKSFFRVRRVMWAPLRPARKMRRILWLKLKNGVLFATRRRRFFLRLRDHSYGYHHGCSRGSSSESSCFW